MNNKYKNNWEDSERRFNDWWNRKGVVVGGWYGLTSSSPRSELKKIPANYSSEDKIFNPELRAKFNFNRIAYEKYPADILPVSETNIGPGSLSLFLGAEPRYADGDIWLVPGDRVSHDPENWSEFIFNEECRWWRLTEAILSTAKEISNENYFVGLPDLVSNLDILSTLRGADNLMMDLIDRPDWVKKKLGEINKVWFTAFERCYEIIKSDDGGMAVDCFRVYGKGKTGLLQCDASAMISPEMFEEFVLPYLKEQTEILDFSVYHLDGPDAVRHLDLILSLEKLDAVEWTPGTQVPSGDDPKWRPMLKKIRSAGKSLQLVDIPSDKVEPLLNDIGKEGVYIIPSFKEQDEARKFYKKINSILKRV